MCTDGIDGLQSVRDTHVALSPCGEHLYVASSDNTALHVFARDTLTGLLTHVQTLFAGDGGIDGLEDVGGVAVSPDGKNVYAAAWEDDALLVFSRSPGGQPTYLEAHRDDGTNRLIGARSVAVSPDGGHVYVAASDFYLPSSSALNG